MEFQVGRFQNISLQEYHEMEGYSKSNLDKINVSMNHYFESLKKKEVTRSMIIGSAFHCMVLTPSEFDKEFAVLPECDRRTKEGKNIYAAFVEANFGKTIIDSEDYEIVGQMARNIVVHPVASQLLTNGKPENSFMWIDKESGLKCKCRPDYTRYDNLMIDLKSTDSAVYRDFQRSVINYRYHVQAAYCIDGVNAVEGDSYDTFVLIAVENKAPFNVAVYNVDQAAIELGREAYHLDLFKVVEYYDQPESERWAGYPCMIQELSLPSYMY